MSGHSKWATIKRKKGANDAQRGKIFTKFARELQLAAREGADPNFNFRLRLIIDKAKAENMPKDNIERAIKRGAGIGEDGAQIEEITYEGYGPHGVALLIQTLTDNKNRTVSELRRALTRAGGSLAESGERRLAVRRQGLYQPARWKAATRTRSSRWRSRPAPRMWCSARRSAEIYTEPSDLQAVRQAFQAGKVRDRDRRALDGAQDSRRPEPGRHAAGHEPDRGHRRPGRRRQGLLEPEHQRRGAGRRRACSR